MSDVLPKKIHPMNRHLLIVPNYNNKEEEKPAVLLPEGYKPPKERYVAVTVLDVSRDCSENVKALKFNALDNPVIIVDRSMIEEVRVFDKTYYLILENHIVGAVRDFNEN